MSILEMRKQLFAKTYEKDIQEEIKEEVKHQKEEQAKQEEFKKEEKDPEDEKFDFSTLKLTEEEANCIKEYFKNDEQKLRKSFQYFKSTE